MLYSACKKMIGIIRTYSRYFAVIWFLYMAFGLVSNAVISLYEEEGIVASLKVAGIEFIPNMIVHTLATGLVIFGVYQACSGIAPRYGDGFKLLKTCFVRMFIANITITIFVMFGTIFLIIPGIYILVTCAFLLPVILVEGRTLTESESINGRVVDGWRWRILNVYAAHLLVVLVVMFIPGVVIYSTVTIDQESIDTIFRVAGFVLMPITTAVWIMTEGVIALFYLMARWDTWDLSTLTRETDGESNANTSSIQENLA